MGEADHLLLKRQGISRDHSVRNVMMVSGDARPKCRIDSVIFRIVADEGRASGNIFICHKERSLLATLYIRE